MSRDRSEAARTGHRRRKEWLAQGVAPNPTSGPRPHLIPHRAGYRRFETYSVPLQEHPGAPVEIARIDVPGWLSRSEAEKLCRLLCAVAVDDCEVAALWVDEGEGPSRYGGWA